MSVSRAKGTAWETAIVAYLQARGWPHAERRALAGHLDRGDIAGLVGVCLSAKSVKRLELAQWADEAASQAARGGADIAAVWFKRRGHTSPGRAYVLLDGHTFTKLLKEAGY